MLRFVALRVGDKNLLRLIRRFLKAGVPEDGAFSATDKGTPQVILVSPVLSNIYLHYTLDLWFERRFSWQCRGKAFLVRYCDDFVTCFDLNPTPASLPAGIRSNFQNCKRRCSTVPSAFCARTVRQSIVSSQAQHPYLAAVSWQVDAAVPDYQPVEFVVS
jgi:hypothetical protein